ncbi:MAG: DUF1080 domain-containing protein [Balneolaceae bacterium]
MIRLVTLFTLLIAITIYGCETAEPEETAEMNELTEAEIEEGWTLLFDGESTDQWRGYNMDSFPEIGWEAEDGLLVFNPPSEEERTSPLDIITKEIYSDFEFKIDWMIERGGNSGIFYHILEQERAIYWSGPELQLLDNENHPDAEQGINHNRKAGSLYDLIPADPQNTKLYSEWNSVKIVSNGSTIEHWQNGEKVVEYERWTEEWFNMLHESKFKGFPEFGAMRQGHLGLQDHGDEVKFRNIKIRDL